MKKSEIIKMLEKARYWEDEFILKYDSDNFFELLSMLPKNQSEQVKKLFQINITDTKRHKEIMNDLINKIEAGEYVL